MVVKLFNVWYFLCLLISVGAIILTYFILRNKSDKTKKTTLFIISILGLIFHFLKPFYLPYSANSQLLLRDIWFINICGANIFLLPFILISKSDKAKDYIFYIGVISGALALLYPTEALNKTFENPDYIDVFRFYFHHAELLGVPLLMVLLNLHKLSYKRVIFAPVSLLVVAGFVMLNQVLQSELGFIDLRNDNFFKINFKNTSFIWGPGNDPLAKIFTVLCPKIFTIVPVGQYKGQVKYWPWFWLIVPVFIYVTPIAFGLSMIFDRKNFVKDVKKLKKKIKKNLKKRKKKDA